MVFVSGGGSQGSGELSPDPTHTPQPPPLAGFPGTFSKSRSSFWLPMETKASGEAAVPCPGHPVTTPPPGKQGHRMWVSCRRSVGLEFGGLAVPSTRPAPPGKSLVRAPRGEMMPLLWARLLLNHDGALPVIMKYRMRASTPMSPGAL